jgi:hypothetical protein
MARPLLTEVVLYDNYIKNITIFNLTTAYRQLLGSLGLPRISYTIDSIKSLPIPFIQVPNAFLKF